MSSYRMHRNSPTVEGGEIIKVEDYPEVDSNDHQHRLSPSALLASRLSPSQEIPPDVVYRQVYQLRMTQMRQGVDLSGLSRVQWGLQQLKFSHHIVLKKSPFRCVDIPVMFRVTVCKSCCPCQDMLSTFLGVYGDQESALLVNDVHEILNGRSEKLSVLRKEDAMFFHHLTARTLDESEGILLPASPVLSVLEKLRIDSANAILSAAAALEEKKRKRSSTIDILIESSLSLSMTSRENSSCNGEGEEDEDVDADDDDVEGEEEDEYDENGIYSSSSTYRNHAPFSSYPVKVESVNTRMSSPESKYVNVDRAIVTVESILSQASHSAEKMNPLQLLNLSLTQSISLPRTRKSNRPRASTFSVVSSAHTQSNSQSLLDNEAERTPMGLVTWLASLEDDDFVAAKLLSEMCSKDKSEESVPDIETIKSLDIIPRYRGARKSMTTTATVTASQKDSSYRIRDDGSEPPTQRRRRANSVIEMTRQAKSNSPAADEVFHSGDNIANLNGTGRIPRTYRKDPNWASEGRSRGYVGAYSPAERRRRIERFLEKRRLRVWQKNVKYDVRKNFADSRIRVKGRFVKKEDQAAMMLSMRLGANKEQNISEAEDEEEKGMDEVEAEVEAEVEVDNNAGVDGYDDEDCECDVDIDVDIEVDVDENDVSLIKKKSSETTVTLTGKGSVAGTLDCDRDAVDNVGRKSRDCSSSRHITEEPDLTAGSKDDINFFNLCGEKGREGGDEDDDDDVRDDDIRDENGNVDINRIPNNSSISGFES